MDTYYVMAGSSPVLVHNAPTAPDPYGVPKAPGVYIIYLDNGNVYVGQGKNLSQRWQEHFGSRGKLKNKYGLTMENVIDVKYRLAANSELMTLNRLEIEVYDEMGDRKICPITRINLQCISYTARKPRGCHRWHHLLTN
jgi:hypothetical protein